MNLKRWDTNLFHKNIFFTLKNSRAEQLQVAWSSRMPSHINTSNTDHSLWTPGDTSGADADGPASPHLSLPLLIARDATTFSKRNQGQARLFFWPLRKPQHHFCHDANFTRLQTTSRDPKRASLCVKGRKQTLSLAVCELSAEINILSNPADNTYRAVLPLRKRCTEEGC